MNIASASFVDLLGFLLPGFLTAWIFHGLTAHAKPTQFERVVQALIFTTIVQVVVVPARELLLWGGAHANVGPWTDEVSYTWAMFTAY